MRRLPIVITAVLLLCTTLFASVQSFSKKPVQLAWFYKPPKDGDLDVLASRFNWFVLTRNDEAIRDELKVKGVQGPFLQYLRFDAIEDPGSCTAQPHRNQVADEKGDFCQISKNHPDWFLRNASGKIIRSEGYVMMDPGNKGWQKYWLARARQDQQKYGWDGVFLDNVEASLTKRKQKGEPANYRTEDSYLAAIEDFLSFIYKSYFQPNKHPLFANIIAVKDSRPWFDILDYLDGAMVEAFAVDWHDGYRDSDEWEEQMTLAEKAQGQGKLVILVAQGERNDDRRQQFAFASYLLVTRGRAAFRYSRANHYVQTWLYKNYQLQLGQPLGSRYQKHGTWFRDFEKATVSVNPSRHTSDIILK